MTNRFWIIAGLAIGCGGASDAGKAPAGAEVATPAQPAPPEAADPATSDGPPRSDPVAGSPDTSVSTRTPAASGGSPSTPVTPPRDTVRPATPAPTDPASDASQTQTGADALRRAATAYGRIRSLRATFAMEQENPLLRKKTSSRGTLMQRRPDRILLRFTQPAGDIIVSDGAHIWVYYPSVDAKQVIRAAAGSGGAGGVDLQAQFVGDPLQRFDYVAHGTEDVAGREADVLTLTPKSEIGYDKLKVWIDRKDGLVRRFEITEHNGSIRRFELSDIELNPTLQDDVFEFSPPAGATIVDRG